MLQSLRFHKLKKASAPSPDFQRALRQKLVGEAPYHRPFTALNYAAMVAVLALAIFFSVSTYAYASPAVSEGTTLFPLKTSIERLEGRLHRSPEARALFLKKILRRRAAERRYLLEHATP